MNPFSRLRSYQSWFGLDLFRLIAVGTPTQGIILSHSNLALPLLQPVYEPQRNYQFASLKTYLNWQEVLNPQLLTCLN